MNDRTDTNQELNQRIVEFEHWCRINKSKDLDAYTKEKQLPQDIVERIRQFQQMEGRLSHLKKENLADVPPTGGEVNRSVGNYQLEKELGVGGMGAVWLAKQSHPVSRKVAVKLIRADRDSAIAAKRFEREKQALALMSNPHVAQVYDAGISEENGPYIAMEYVDGEHIADYCQKRQLPLRDRLELFLQLCSAIQHAHQNGFLHRDIKPANVLVTEADGNATVKVIDFGLVRPSESRNPQITEPDMIVGSPLWMSPEQARGSRVEDAEGKTAQVVDTRADVYSLGVILYQLLTDTTPITDDFYERATKLELLQSIQNDVPELPSTRVSDSKFRVGKSSTPVSSWAGVLRNELDWVTMRALEKERDRRYPTVAAFAADIENYLNHEPVTAKPPSFTYRLKKLAQRHKTGAIASGIVVGMIALSSVAFAVLWSQSIKMEKLARESAARAQRESELRGRAMKLTAVVAQNFNPSANAARLTESQLETLNRTREELDKDDFSSSPEAEADFRMILATFYSGAAEHDSAVAQYRKAVGIYEGGTDVRALVAAKLKLGEELAQHWDFVSAKEIGLECIEASKQFGNDDELAISSNVLVSEVSFPLGADDADSAEFEKTVELARATLGEKHPVTIRAFAAIGELNSMNRRVTESAEQIKRALELATEVYGPNLSLIHI